MDVDYSKNLIKEYKYWSLYVHENQGYLGRCIVWCKREEALDLTDATLEEREELFIILQKLRQAIQTVFNPDWLNYAFLGNETRHLHGHYLPRYAAPKTFMDTVFEDKLYAHNYKTDHTFVTTSEIREAVRQKLAEILDK